jgi:hypothetical protein
MVHQDKLQMDERESSQRTMRVTALVVQDLLNGDIVKTPLTEGWHFYNVIEGNRYDFTDSQFESPIHYENLPSYREEAFSDTNTLQYNHLTQSLIALIKKDGSPTQG